MRKQVYKVGEMKCAYCRKKIDFKKGVMSTLNGSICAEHFNMGEKVFSPLKPKKSIKKMKKETKLEHRHEITFVELHGICDCGYRYLKGVQRYDEIFTLLLGRLYKS